MNIFGSVTILWQELKLFTLICVCILFIFVYMKLKRKWYIKFLLSGAVVFAAIMQYEIFWNAAYLLVIKKYYWLAYDMLMFPLVEGLIITTLRKLYKVKLNLRLFWVVSIFMVFAMIWLWSIGYFPLSHFYIEGHSTYDPTLYYPYNVVWAVGKGICILSWIWIVKGEKNKNHIK